MACVRVVVVWYTGGTDELGRVGSRNVYKATTKRSNMRYTLVVDVGLAAMA